MASSPRLSLVIPAYDEAARLPGFLESVRAYLDGPRSPGLYEVLVVDDGSRDGTARLVEAIAAEWPELRLLRQPTNCGKGAAVRRGVSEARGHAVLYADADGATPIEEEAKLRATLAAGADLAVASRMVAGTERVERAVHRAWIGRVFASVSRLVVPMTVRDPQCGFKMFRRAAARRLFPLTREDGYLLDTELLGLARRLGYRTAEVRVNWHEVAGSKVHLVHDVTRMLTGLYRVRRRVFALSGVAPARRSTAAVAVSAGRAWGA